MEVIHQSMSRLNYQVVRKMRPVLVIVNILTYTAEILSVIASIAIWEVSLFDNIYWYCFGVEVLIAGLFFTIYGFKVQKMLKEEIGASVLRSETAKVNKKIKKIKK